MRLNQIKTSGATSSNKTKKDSPKSFQGECNKTKVYGGFNYIPSQKLFVDVQPLSFLAEKRKIKESL